MSVVKAPLATFLIGGLLFVTVTLTTQAAPNLAVIPDLITGATELKMWEMGLDPCQFGYYRNVHNQVVRVKFTNYADKAHEYDMGDGKKIWLSAGESIDYKYKVTLQGDTVRIEIKRLVTGLVQNSLILRIVKLEPKVIKKGGEL